MLELCNFTILALDGSNNQCESHLKCAGYLINLFHVSGIRLSPRRVEGDVWDYSRHK